MNDGAMGRCDPLCLTVTLNCDTFQGDASGEGLVAQLAILAG
jgi:hypothetical protein